MGIFDGLATGILGAFTGSSSAKKQNKANAAEAAKNRAWQETQATTAFDRNQQSVDTAFDRNTQAATTAWDRTMEASNTSHQRQMADMQKAGLNPILSAGGGGASSAQSVMAQSSAAAASSGGGAQAKMEKVDPFAEGMKKASEALGIKGQQTDNKTRDWQRKLTSQNVQKSYNETELTSEKVKTEKLQQAVTANSAKNVDLQSQTLAAELVEKLNRASLSSTDFGQVLQVIERLTGIVSPFKGK